MTPLEVQLPVCPVPGCGNVGKQPNNGSFHSHCTGPTFEPHRRTKMELRTFREVPDLKEAA